MKILIAEDDQVSQDILRILLTRHGQEVIAASNGQEAMVLLLRHDVDMMFLDITMPLKDGCEVLREVRSLDSKKSRLPIVVVTAHAMNGDQERFLRLGATGYIAKPFFMEDILHALHSFAPQQKQKAILTRRHLDYCHYIYQFQNVSRYHGAMPASLLTVSDQAVVHYLFNRGLIAKTEVTTDTGHKVKGYILTDTGRNMLQQESSKNH